MTTAESIVADRRAKVVAAAEEAGLLGGSKDVIGARVPKPLLKAAKERTGLSRTTDVIEYALAKLALEDDFGPKLLARKGRVSRDLDLEF